MTGKLNKDNQLVMTKLEYGFLHSDYRRPLTHAEPMALHLNPKTGATCLYPVKFIK